MVQEKLPLKLDPTEVECSSCGCVVGYGRPPSVAECPCVCHDTSRLWWSIRPWRADPCPECRCRRNMVLPNDGYGICECDCHWSGLSHV